MNSVTSALLLLCIIILVIIVIRYRSAKKKYEHPTYLQHLETIKAFIEEVNSFDDYVTWITRDGIKTRYAVAGRYFKNKTNYYKKESTVQEFNTIYGDWDQYIKQYNRDYVSAQKEKLEGYFNDIEGKTLDDQQRTAIITDEYSNLIIAGAGSGKTLTILGKVQYLIEQKKIDPNEILLLSFTKKTVEELNHRLQKINLNTRATTFHKLGYDLIKTYYEAVPVVTNENTLSSVVTTYLQEDLFNDTDALQAYIQYVACYMNIPEDYDHYGSLGEKTDTEKGIDFVTLREKCEPLNMVANAIHDTLKGERVKSVEELMIANYLYLNGIDYEYEKSYPYGTEVYRPDFYLTEYNLYLEHFGVDEHNRAKWLTDFYEEKYVAEMELKRQTHATYNTRLLETYSYYNRDNVLLEKLEELLEAEQVVFKPRDVQEIYTRIAENDANFGKELNKLIESFINLAKSRQLNRSALVQLFTDNKDVENEFMYERQELFLGFVLPILEKYDATLGERNEIDFNDMINKATDALRTHKPPFNYRYIIIDEYQDISFSRFNLIKELRDLSGARLVCVGDDWQSIYRFAGSDISLFSNFGKYVGIYEQLLIEQTYRNSQSLIDVSAAFVQKNPRQIAKRPQSRKEELANPVKFVHYDADAVVETFMNELQQIVGTHGNKASILVLGRHRFEINDLIKVSAGDKIRYIERTGKLEVTGFEDVDIHFSTVHKSKGTEADFVIVLNMKNHLLGFPNKMTDDPILSLLLSDTEDYRFAEERRLFYVALTRTKNEVVLLVPQDVSLFAGELLTDHNYLLTTANGTYKTTHCPYCKTGRLVVRRNGANGNQFLGCSHYPVCDQTFNNIAILDNSILCSGCMSGYMVKRSGKFGVFFGCTNYPRCGSTVRLN